MTEENNQTNEDEQATSAAPPEPVQETGSGPEAAPPTGDSEGSNKPDPAETADPLELQLASVKEQLLRKAADFENYKRRTESEIRNIVRLANETLVLAILPIVDDLERSLKAQKNTDDVASFQKGVELILQKLTKTLEAQGVTPLDTSGKVFDVHYHDAMMQLPTSDAKPDTILEEVEKGYSMNGKVIRHAKVVVAAPPTDENATGEKDAAT